MTINRFALLCDWPSIKAAENETIRRISRAAAMIDKEAVVINRQGEIIDLEKQIYSSNNFLKNEDVDFVINLHFSSPRVFDGFSYVLLWNPLKFLHDWNYSHYISNVVSNHDAISCGSSFADECFYRHSFCNDMGHLFPEIKLNHTNCGPYFDFHDDKDGIFYCGIGWDKSKANPQQRFHDVFKILDKKSVLKIYGPKKLGKNYPWKEFSSYHGEIAFDGTSLFKTISQCLLGLAISHPAHIETEIATSRIFEIIAGGALPLCDNNAFIKKNFGDMVLYIEGVTHEEKAESILRHYNWTLNNKSTVRKMVENLQILMKQKFDLSAQLKHLYEQHLDRRKKIEDSYFSKLEKFHANLIYFLNDKNDDLSTLVRSFKTQIYKNKSLFILTNLSDFNFAPLRENDIQFTLLKASSNIENSQIGLMLQDTIKNLPEGTHECFMIFTRNCLMHYDHITSMVRVLEDYDETELVDFADIKTDGTKARVHSRNSVENYAKQFADIKTDGTEARAHSRNSVENYAKQIELSICKPFLLRKLPPFFILNSLNLSHFTAVVEMFFKNKKNTKKSTAVMSSLKSTTESNYNNITLFFDIVLLNQDLKNLPDLNITKRMIYEVFDKISFLKSLMLVRKISLKTRDRLRQIKKNIKSILPPSGTKKLL